MSWYLKRVDGTTHNLSNVIDLGSGLPDLNHHMDTRGQSHGARYERTVARPRVFTLLVPLLGSGYDNLRSLRADLEAFLWPDTGDGELVEVHYVYNTVDIYLEAVLEAGMGKGRWEGFAEVLALRFLAPDPLPKAAATITPYTPGSRAPEPGLINYFLEYREGNYVVGSGFNDEVYALAYGPDGSLYAGGRFTTDSTGGTQLRRFAKFDGFGWSEVGGAGPNDGYVSAITFDAAGNIYIGGQFAGFGFGAANNVVYWDGSQWLQLGPPTANPTAKVYDMMIGPDGKLYVAGFFTNWNGLSAADYLARWDFDTSSWEACGTFNGTVDQLARGPAGQLYAFGLFTQIDGQAVARVAEYDFDTGTWGQVGNGLWATAANLGSGGKNGDLLALPDGRLMATGQPVEDQAGQAGVSIWNGSAWEKITEALDDNILDLELVGETVVAAGKFGEINGIETVDSVAVWNGSAWTNFPINLDAAGLLGALPVYALAYNPDNKRLAMAPGGNSFGGRGPDTRTWTNPGTALSPIVITFTGPGRVTNLINYTTGQAIYMDLELGTGEEVVLDMSRELHTGPYGRPTRDITMISSWRGNVIGRLLPGGDEADWALAPGSNKVSVYCEYTVDWSATTRPRYRSMDGIH